MTVRHAERDGRIHSVDATILVVLDEGTANGTGTDLEALLRDAGHVATISSPTDWPRIEPDARAAVQVALVDATDDGIDAAGRIRRELEIPIVYMTDASDPELLRRSDDTEPAGYVETPVSRVQLSLAIRSALSVHAREARRRDTEVALQQQIDGLRPGESLAVGNERTIDRLPHPYDQSVLLHAVLDGMSDGVIVVDRTSGILYANKSAKDMVGKDIENVPPEAWPSTYGVYDADGTSLVHWDTIPLVRALAGESVHGEQFVIRNENRPDGATIVALAHPLTSADGKRRIGAFGLIHDVTRQRLADAELREALRTTESRQLKLAAILESMSEGVVTAKSDGELDIFNAKAEEMIGVGKLAVDPEEWSRAYGIYEPDDDTLVPFDELPLSRALRGEHVVGKELTIRNKNHPDGRLFRVHADPILGKSGVRHGGVAIIQDITSEKAAQARDVRQLDELRQQHSLLETVFDSVTEGIIVVDENGHTVRMNRVASQIGFPVNENDNETVYHLDRKTLVEPDDFPVLRAALRGESVDNEDFVVATDAPVDATTLSSA